MAKYWQAEEECGLLATLKCFLHVAFGGARASLCLSTVYYTIPLAIFVSSFTTFGVTWEHERQCLLRMPLRARVNTILLSLVDAL
jgi:hypothetical protein